VHIPKTAGTSFRKSLKVAYGDAEVVRLDISLETGKIRLNEELYPAGDLPKGTRAIHGHFRPADILEQFPESEGKNFITWMRHPVDRVISNYYYLEKRLREELDEEGKNLNILSKMQRSLLEYTGDEINRNRQRKFLEGMPLEDFKFVGILEHYTEDLAELGLKMGWVTVEEKTVNVTAKTRPVVSDEVRAEIARLNAEDMALYERALHLRSRRKSKPEVELISIHIPKTAGTSFYQTLQEVYGNGVTDALRRGHLRRMERGGYSLTKYVSGEKKVIHGHLYYEELDELRHEHDAKVICWLRDPVERVISNYHFFKNGLADPSRNRRNYELNKHRKNESLRTYAGIPENCNVMSKFLAGIDLEELFFIGFTEDYANDLNRLAGRLEWPAVSPAHLNTRKYSTEAAETIDEELKVEIARLNAEDIALYQRALEIKNASPGTDE
jgi:hypothetical protein